MPAEKESYRDNLERICEAFPDKELLRIDDVCKFLGKNYRTARKIFPKEKYPYGISKAVLARMIS